MKRRSELSAGEVNALYADLDRRLDAVGLETQPRVALRLLDLSADPSSGMSDFARAIAHDAVLTGRLLKMANSAFFAQREPVTNVDRACVLLGCERLKAVALGFYLSRAASSDARRELSRRVWGESVFRACLASELAKSYAPGLTAEAFVVGLMLEAGMPLAAALLGAQYYSFVDDSATPAKQYIREFTTLPFTHVDVVTTLARRWKLPELLAKPIEWHHTVPGEGEATAPAQKLQRIAYYVGSLRLDASTSTPNEATPMRLVAEKHFGLGGEELASVIAAATKEYKLSAAVFRDVGDEVGAVEELARRVSEQLAEVMEDVMISQTPAADVRRESFEIDGLRVEIEIDANNAGRACVLASDGQKLMATNFSSGPGAARRVLSALGFERSAAGAETLRSFVERAA
ncbi:MAG: HDOD domain-containing protein [Phycisphaerales bacterium]|jgi:HD-like signal output (HDOD) protein|nr:HDOD domain-containing protein [Phycisphaerales bacterium]